jgi:hypothetical protein
MSTKPRTDAEHAAHFNDPAVYMLGLPKARPRIRGWLVFAILAGAILAIAVLVSETFIAHF